MWTRKAYIHEEDKRSKKASAPTSDAAGSSKKRRSKSFQIYTETLPGAAKLAAADNQAPSPSISGKDPLKDRMQEIFRFSEEFEMSNLANDTNRELERLAVARLTTNLPTIMAIQKAGG